MDKNGLYNKIIIFGIIILLTGTCIIPATGSIIQKQASSNGQLYLENIIYVDDDNTEGPWDGTIEHPYLYIQEGIYHADHGDTVYVFSGTYYNQYAYIDKTINLIGEDKETTMIYTGSTWWIVEIYADNVNVSGFTFRNNGFAEFNEKMYIEADYCTISDNIFADERSFNCLCTLKLNDSHHNVITRNRFGVLTSQLFCIYLENSNYNTISENKFRLKIVTMQIKNSNTNIIIDNTFIVAAGNTARSGA